MQTLDTIKLGQTPNDGTGDEHRTAFQKVNANFDKVVEGIGEVGDAAQDAADAAQAAGQLASEAIPAVEKGNAGGVAPLDDAGKVPAEHLPELEEFIPMAQKGAPEGVATLGEDGKVTPGQLPNAVDAIPLAQKGQPEGVATLNAQGMIPESQLPELSFVPQEEKGEAGGVATLDVDGLVPESQLPPIPSGPAVGTPDWWPLRSSIPAGQIPLDGQTVSRATYPDLAAMVIAGTLPVVADAAWQSDPTQRGMYTLGDGSTTIRVPDMNGKAAGSLGAVFRRGDGTRSAGAGGALQADVVGPHAHTTTMAFAVGSGSVWAAGNGASATYTLANGAGVGTETRPLNVTGVWTVHAFGAVVNPGSVDAAQLASDLATTQAELALVRAGAFGIDQSMQNVIADRASGTNYTNSTNRPIMVFIQAATTSTGGNIYATVSGVICARSYIGATSAKVAIQFMVPPGGAYSVDRVAASIELWSEYR